MTVTEIKKTTHVQRKRGVEYRTAMQKYLTWIGLNNSGSQITNPFLHLPNQTQYFFNFFMNYK